QRMNGKTRAGQLIVKSGIDIAFEKKFREIQTLGQLKNDFNVGARLVQWFHNSWTQLRPIECILGDFEGWQEGFTLPTGGGGQNQICERPGGIDGGIQVKKKVGGLERGFAAQRITMTE